MDQLVSQKERFIIGLTGNIGTGKSLVRKMLQHLGAMGVDADALANRALSSNSPAFEKVIQRFGKQVLDESGQLNRKKIAAIVFNDKDALLDLEQILHPLVSIAARNLIAHSHLPIIVIEAIKLLESGLVGMCDKIWVVDTDESALLDRITSQRGMTVEEICERISNQSSAAYKRERADVVIENNLAPFHTWQRVLKSWDLLEQADSDFRTSLKITTDLTTFYKQNLIIPGTDQFTAFEGAVSSASTIPPPIYWFSEKNPDNSSLKEIEGQDRFWSSLSHFVFSLTLKKTHASYMIWDLSQFNLTLKGYVRKSLIENLTDLEKQLSLIEDFAKLQLSETITLPNQGFLKEEEPLLRELGYNSISAGDVKDIHRKKAVYNVYQKDIREDLDLFSS